MNILILTNFFLQDYLVASHRIHGWTDCWCKKGHNVFLITSGFINRITIGDRIVIYEIPKYGIFTRFLRRGGYRDDIIFRHKDRYRSKFFKRIVHITKMFGGIIFPDELCFWLFPAYKCAKKIMMEYNIDTVISSFGPPSIHILGALIKRLNPEIKWIMDYRDLWTKNPIFNIRFYLKPINLYLESHCIKMADGITVVSKAMADFFINRFKKEVYIVPNGFDVTWYNDLDPKPVFEDKKIRLTYIGTLYAERRNPEVLFIALRDIINQGIKLDNRLEILFYGYTHFPLDILIRKYYLEGIVKHCGWVSHKDALRIQRDSDALLFFEREDDKGVITGKIFEYLWSSYTWGKPILAIGLNGGNELGDILKKSGCVYLLGHDVGRIIDIIIKLINGDKLHISPNKLFIDQFRTDIQAEKMLDIIGKRI